MELLAIGLQQEVTGKRVLVKSDNATAVAYISKQGGKRSPDLLLWCHDRGIHLSATHIPGIDNLIADSLMRGRLIRPTEWALAPQVAEAAFCRLGQPLIDLFTSKANKQLPIYCTRVHDLEAYAVDALLISWEGMTGYTFPPIPLNPQGTGEDRTIPMHDHSHNAFLAQAALVPIAHQSGRTNSTVSSISSRPLEDAEEQC